MRRSSLLLFVLALLVPAPAAAKLKVAATIPDLAAVAQEIAGDAVEVTALSSHTQDPHFADPKPSLVLAVNRADLLLIAGLDLEAGWLGTLVTQSRNPRVQVGASGHLDCAQFIRPLEVPIGRVDRSMGDLHGGGNPHYLHDPRAMIAVARGIAERLAQLDPAARDHYGRGLTALVDRLERSRRHWQERMAAHRGERVLSYHRSWPYLFDWLGLVGAGEIEPKPGIPPTPAHAAATIVQGRQRGVRVIVRESYHRDATTEVISKQLGARIVDLPAGVDLARGETYADRVETMIRLLEEAFAATGKQGGR